MQVLIGQLKLGRTIHYHNGTYTAQRGKQLLEDTILEQLHKKISHKNLKSRYTKSFPAFIGEKR